MGWTREQKLESLVGTKVSALFQYWGGIRLQVYGTLGRTFNGYFVSRHDEPTVAFFKLANVQRISRGRIPVIRLRLL